MPTVCENFTFDGREIVRELRVGGSSGTSRVPVDASLWEDTSWEDTSQEALKAIWDKAFLLGAVDYTPEGGHPKPKKTVRVADVFCGAGGLSYGAREAARACGLRPVNVLAVDVDSVALEVYRRNFDPASHSTRNLWTSVTINYSARRSRTKFLSRPSLLTEELQACEGKVDILLGGPPCEGHSTSNNLTRRSDPRNAYYAVMPALAVALDAEAAIVENVPGIQHDSRHILEQAKSLFESSGYLIAEGLADAVSLGLPQTRKRHILIASKTRKPDINAVLEALSRRERDLRWAIGDLEDTRSEATIDASAELSEVNRRRIDHLFDNDEYDLENEMRPDSHKGGHTYPSIYGRLRWDRPAGTVTTGFNTPGRGRHIHPSRRRTLTAHEAARIQGFPDSFEFKLINGSAPTRTSLANIIGDAVPPQIGYAAGVAALATLDGV